MEKRINIAPFIMFLLFIGVIGMGVYIYLDYQEEKDNEVPTYLSTVFKVTENDKIAKVIKDYSYDNNLADKDNIETWEFESIKYIGYLEGNKDEVYYRVSGTYSCKDLSSDCVYMDQVIDKSEIVFGYEVYVTLEKVDDGYKLLDISSGVETVTNVVSDDKEGVRGTGYTLDELVEVYKNYMISNGYVLKPDLNEWTAKLTYVGSNKDKLIFFASNSYSCLSGTSYCIYQAQTGENPYVFDLALTMEKDIDGIYKFTSIEPKHSVVIEKPAMEEDIVAKKITRSIMNDKLKEFFISNGHATEDNINKFDVTYVTYLGDLISAPGSYGLKATITFTCKSGGSSCVVVDVMSDPTSKDYTFNVAFDMVATGDGDYSVTQIYTVGNTDHINLNNLVIE